MAAHAKKKPVEAEDKPEIVHGIKGFDSGLKCRGHQFQIGETYRHEGPVKVCKSGYHAITEHPLAVFGYYAPAGSRFCRVTLSGAMDSDNGVKTAAEILTVGDELGLSKLTQEAVAWVLACAKPESEAATGSHGAASATGSQGAASATGSHGAASATGYQGAASATSSQGAASATGDQGAASAPGYQGAASATGNHGAAMASGCFGQVRGADGNALFAVERKTWNGPIVSVAAGIAGRDGIKADTWYRAQGGQLVEVSQ